MYSKKVKLWNLIERFRSSGGREEHWKNKNTLDAVIDDMLEDYERVRMALKAISQTSDIDAAKSLAKIALEETL